MLRVAVAAHEFAQRVDHQGERILEFVRYVDEELELGLVDTVGNSVFLELLLGSPVAEKPEIDPGTEPDKQKHIHHLCEPARPKRRPYVYRKGYRIRLQKRIPTFQAEIMPAGRQAAERKARRTLRKCHPPVIIHLVHEAQTVRVIVLHGGEEQGEGIVLI